MPTTLDYSRLGPTIAGRRWCALTFAAVMAACLLSTSAYAGLGEPTASVAHDHAVLHGQSLTVTAAASYQVHEIKFASGTRLREFISPSGMVFAVAWSGIELPDLKQVLASHYASYAAEAARHRTNHKVLVISSPDLNLQILKLPRGFAGAAHVPALIPVGTDPADLR